MSMSVLDALWSKLKYLSNHWMDSSGEVELILVKILTFPLAPPAGWHFRGFQLTKL